MLEHRGIRWGYVFLSAAAYIDGEQMRELMVQAVEMYLRGETSRNVEGSSYEGRLYTEMKYEVIGSLGGQRFDLELDTTQGQDKAAFLVSEQTGGMGPTISRN
jgi:hypothetical protein